MGWINEENYREVLAKFNRIRPRLDAAERRFCSPELMSYEAALQSFSDGLRRVMRTVEEDVDVIEAKRYFRLHLDELNYAHEVRGPDSDGKKQSISLDNQLEMSDAEIVELGREFPRYAKLPADAMEDSARALIDQLISQTELYNNAAAVKELLDFTVRLRHVAPFNGMLLHIQKPGLTFAARSSDWWDRFRRRPKPFARPLVVLRNFGPVEFVYDVLDTEGEPLPEAAFAFPTSGEVPEDWIGIAIRQLAKIEIKVIWLDRGDSSAGHARQLKRHGNNKKLERFEVGININHPPGVQLVTLAHELAHIYLGHCGADPKRGVKFLRPADLALREVEAETVAYLVAQRTGIAPKSAKYLDGYKGAFERLDHHRILKSAGSVEKELGLPFMQYRIFG